MIIVLYRTLIQVVLKNLKIMTWANMQDEWIQELNKNIQENLANPDFNILYLAQQMGMSERQFYRKVKQQTGYRPHQLVQSVRLEKANELLQSKEYTCIVTISKIVGFKNFNVFANLYLQEYGRHPDYYL